jgi:hypothetical protein
VGALTRIGPHFRFASRKQARTHPRATRSDVVRSGSAGTSPPHARLAARAAGGDTQRTMSVIEWEDGRIKRRTLYPGTDANEACAAAECLAKERASG